MAPLWQQEEEVGTARALAATPSERGVRHIRERAAAHVRTLHPHAHTRPTRAGCWNATRVSRVPRAPAFTCPGTSCSHSHASHVHHIRVNGTYPR